MMTIPNVGRMRKQNGGRRVDRRILGSAPSNLFSTRCEGGVNSLNKTNVVKSRSNRMNGRYMSLMKNKS